MLELLVRALIELITGEKPKGPPPRRNRSPQRPRPSQPGGDPFRRERVPPAQAPAQPEQLTLEDVIRRMTGLEEEEPETAPPPPPPPAPRRQQAAQQGRRGARQRQQQRPAPIPAHPVAAAAAPVAEPAPAAKDLSATDQPFSLDFVAALRDDPDAARRAFVYAEIFGKPVADR